jgi:hypothetical protein
MYILTINKGGGGIYLNKSAIHVAKKAYLYCNCIFVPHNKCSNWNKQYYNKSSLDKILCDIYSMPITVFPLHTGSLDYLQVIIL